MAEVVKTGLLAGEPFWELPDDELVRRCAAFKAAVCLRDPHDDAASGRSSTSATRSPTRSRPLPATRVTHGRAVALGLLAALRLSGRDTRSAEEILQPQPVDVDRDRAWEAMHRDKKAAAASSGSSCSRTTGPRWDVAVPAGGRTRALTSSITG